MKFLSRKFAAIPSILSIACVTALSGCSTEVMAKAIDVHRCDNAHTWTLIRQDLPYVEPANDGMDHADPSNILTIIYAGFEFPSADDEKGETDEAYKVLTTAMESLHEGFKKNINGKYPTWQAYYDAQTVVANKFLAAVDVFGKACVKAGAGDAFKNGVDS